MLNIDHFHHSLCGGDQLTVARIRGAQSIRTNSESGRNCLDGFIPVAETGMLKCASKQPCIHARRISDRVICL